LKTWQVVMAWVGIIAGFFFFLTIPFWFGLQAWGRYKRGEQSTIKGWMVFGIVVTAFFAVGFLLAAVGVID
jgi:hypothetical protein